MPRRSTVALATAGALASTGTAYLGARNLLVGQATHARTIIPKSFDAPPRADGVYRRGGGPPRRWYRGMAVDLHLMIFGDSTATGYGCTAAEEVPGVMIARGLADLTGMRIRLSTKAIVGATSKGVVGQVDAMFVAGPPPDAALIVIGANDITRLNGVGPSAQRLAASVRKLRARGAVVVVGTCPDLGVITAIPQPLRSLAHTRGVQLARAQAAAVRAAGGVPVPLGHLLAPKFRARPELMFSADRYHPSAAAYALAADALLASLRDALSEKLDIPTLQVPAPPAAAALEASRKRRIIVSRLWDRAARHTTPVAAAESDRAATRAASSSG
ncbi:SGNH/GDSL hydrolase family protein [Mycobacterium angelicum]|uniref:SGNH/GDSL hydrolase family protein n=1 Tax=Mycobacterium angelicum TaxID=470074 RepID=UPI00111C8AD6|nr:SGNH/GDSL hydrolase family protein [Mycobacterium angelicum]MCV7196246.1 SGNH/GDSL hydrolase family protein [Mycobacterium angelicum]